MTGNKDFCLGQATKRHLRIWNGRREKVHHVPVHLNNPRHAFFNTHSFLNCLTNKKRDSIGGFWSPPCPETISLRADEPAYWRKAEVGANERDKSRRVHALQSLTELPKMNQEPAIRPALHVQPLKGKACLHQAPSHQAKQAAVWLLSTKPHKC